MENGRCGREMDGRRAREMDGRVLACTYLSAEASRGRALHKVIAHEARQQRRLLGVHDHRPALEARVAVLAAREVLLGGDGVLR